MFASADTPSGESAGAAPADGSILDRPLSVTVFTDLHGREPKHHVRSLRGMVRSIRERTAPAKRSLPLLKLSSFGNVATIKGSLRHDANVTGVDGIEADYDGEVLSFDEAAKRLRNANIAALLYTSPSHTPNAPRWRVLCPCSHTIAPAERAALADRLNGVVGGVFAHETWALSQAFYFGRLDNAPDHRVELIDGRAIDLATEIVSIPRPRSTPKEGPTVQNAECLGLSIDEIRDILSKLPSDWVEERNDWVRCGMAVHHETLGAEDGYEVWCSWASQSSKFDEADSERVWRSFRSDSPAPVRMATLRAAARAAEIAQMFEVLPDEESSEKEAQSQQQEPNQTEPAVGTAAGDIDAGQRFASAYDNKFLHVFPTKTWLRWNGTRWVECHLGEETEAAKVLAKAMLPRAAISVAKNPNELNKADLAYAVRLNRDGSRLRSVLEMARSVPSMARMPDDFDREPMLLGVANGVLDLTTGNLIPPSPKQLISKQAGTAFDKSAECSLWLRFLEDVQPNPEIRSFLQRAVGYTLTGNIDEEKLFFAYGVGANGKSVFANVISFVAGDYSVCVGAGLLTKGRNESENDRLMALLPGARLVLANETRQGDVWDDKRVKDLASRERINARKLYSEAFSFMPTHKLWIRGNHLPGVLDNSDGFWRRLIPIEFAQQIPPEKQTPDLDRQIIAKELPGVLAWAVRGCLEWQRGGLRVPAEIKARANLYREETDVLSAWVFECCTLNPEARTKVEDAYQSYRWFCGREGMSAPSKPTFSRQIQQQPGIRRDPSRKYGRRIIGLEVRPAHLAFESLGEESRAC